MAEELKPEEKKAEGGNVAGALFKGALGLVFLALGVWALIALRSDLFVLIKGCIGPFLILAGIITLAIAKD